MTLNGVLRAPCGGSHPGQPQVGQAVGVLGVVLGQALGRHLAGGNAQLLQADRSAPPGVEDLGLAARLHQRSGTEALGVAVGTAGAQEGYGHRVACWLDADPVAIDRQMRAHRPARTRAIHALPLETITSWDRLDIEIAAIRQ